MTRSSAPNNTAYEFLPRCLVEFNRQYPDIELELDVGATSLNLTRREADRVIRATTKPPEHLIGRKIATVDWAYYCSKSCTKKNRQLTKSGVSTHRRLQGQALIGADGELQRIPLFACEPSFQTELWILTHPELRRTERIRLLIQNLLTTLKKVKRLSG